MMGLRLNEGIDLAAMALRFGVAVDALIDPRKRALYERQGLVRIAGPRIAVTEAGMPLLDALLPELIALEPELA